MPKPPPGIRPAKTPITLEPAGQAERGTDSDGQAKGRRGEFAEENRLREIIKKHSDFIPYPIYLGEEKQLVNQQTALWRQSPREVEAEKYDEFYRQFTLDFEPPLAHAHMVVDAPVQLYALLFVPSSPEKNIFSLRKEEGLKLYARKVLIQEYSRDLLPEYFRFMQGVVGEDRRREQNAGGRPVGRPPASLRLARQRRAGSSAPT